MEIRPLNCCPLLAACRSASPAPVENPIIASSVAVFSMMMYARFTELYHSIHSRFARSSGEVPCPLRRTPYTV